MLLLHLPSEWIFICGYSRSKKGLFGLPLKKLTAGAIGCCMYLSTSNILLYPICTWFMQRSCAITINNLVWSRSGNIQVWSFLLFLARFVNSVLVCHTCYNCTKALNFQVFRLKDFCRTSEGLLKDFCRISAGLRQDFWRTSERLLKDFWWILDCTLYGLQNDYKSQPPGLRDLLFIYFTTTNKRVYLMKDDFYRTEISHFNLVFKSLFWELFTAEILFSL